ncbi:MAG: phage protease [Trueperaceae bacterium]|nr:phage protease [Trueperaceae bacterium]
MAIDETEIRLAVLRARHEGGVEVGAFSWRVAWVDDEPPREFRLFKYGTIDSTKGSFLFDALSAEMIMQQDASYGNLRSADYEHQALAQPVVRAPAAAWYRLALKEDGLYAVDIEWTPRAFEYLVAKEYRYFSPAFFYEKDTGRIVDYFNFGLTNTPSMHDIPVLLSQQGEASTQDDVPSTERTQDMDNQVLSALGLQPDASRDDAVSVIESQRSELAALRQEATQLRSDAAEVAALRQQVAEMQRAENDARVEALFKQALSEGKIVPAEVAAYKAALANDAGQIEAGRLEPLLTALTARHAQSFKQPQSDNSLLEPSLAGKSYRELSNTERVRLEREDPQTFARLRRDAGLL